MLWSRPLGNGQSGIVVGQRRLFAHYGEGLRETVICLERDDGEPVWQTSYSVTYEAHREDYGGPHATPLLLEDCIVAVSIDAQVMALDRETGAERWSRSLVDDFEVALPQSGYAASPLLWGSRIVLPGLGGKGPGAIALSAKTGETIWARGDFVSSHASPQLIRIQDREILVFHGLDLLVGLDPASGVPLFEQRVRSGAADNVAFTPLWDEESRLLIVSHAYDRQGTQCFELGLDDGEVSIEKRWSNR